MQPSTPTPPPPTGGKIRPKHIATAADENKPFVLLVIEADSRVNWYEVFKGATVGTHPIQVEQTEWPLITVTRATSEGVLISIR
jgi:hypothetical protein